MPLVGKTQTDINTTIGKGSYFAGNFHINGTLRIDGRYEGKYLEVDQLYIGPSGKVKTNIKAGSVIVEGTIIGNITATHRVMLLPTSRVLGDIKTPELIIQNGVVLEGRCVISSDLKTPAKKIIEDEYYKERFSLDKFFPIKKKKAEEK